MYLIRIIAYTTIVKIVYIMLLALDYSCKYAHVYNKAEAERRRRRQPHQCNQSSRNTRISPQKAPSLPAPHPGGGGRPVTLALALTITFLSCASRTSAPAEGGRPMSTRLDPASRPHWLLPAARGPAGSQAGFKGVGSRLLPCHRLPARRSAGRGGLPKGPPRGVPEGRPRPPPPPPRCTMRFPRRA